MFMQGQLIFSDSDDVAGAADAAIATLATWLQITNGDAPANVLGISFTPAQNCIIIARVTLRAKHSVVGANMYLGVSVNDVVAKQVDFPYMNSASVNQSKNLTYKFDGVAGTAYSIKGLFYNATAGTITIGRVAAVTWMDVEAYATP